MLSKWITNATPAGAATSFCSNCVLSAEIWTAPMPTPPEAGGDAGAADPDAAGCDGGGDVGAAYVQPGGGRRGAGGHQDGDGEQGEKAERATHRGTSG